MKKKRVIRKLVDKDFNSFLEIWAGAYPGAVPDKFTGEMKRQKIEEWIKTNNENAAVNFYGCFQDSTLVGGIILYDFKINLYTDQIVDCGGIGEVCVDLLHKKEHISKELMEFAHNHYYDRGYCLTCLYPFRPDFYAKMGYGIGNKMNQYSFEPKSLSVTQKDNISYLTLEDAKSLSECFNRYATSTHGMILRSDGSSTFNQMLSGMKVIGYREDERLIGYLAFRIRKVEGGSWLQHNIHIMEFIYESPKAFRGLLTFLATQQDQVHRILYNTHDHDFHHFLKEPRSRGNESIFHIFQESNIQGVGIMYRVINVTKFFSLLSDHCFGGQSIKLKISIQDTFIPENNGSYIIHFQKGKPKVISAQEDNEVEMSIDIARFSSLIMGAVGLSKLYNYGLVELSDTRFLKLLDKLFSTDQPPFTIEPF
ncbi:MAG: GNAT family N-acetyltransferase [Candidatus Heimdallarchaeota archaeon]|nr:MAG: GNAT family N-acetyltransferase [Candidatus Heimdallarchaeota archaeon]